MGLKQKTETVHHFHCRFDIKNHNNTCLLEGRPCKYKGKEDKCPHLREENANAEGTYGKEFKFSYHRM